MSVRGASDSLPCLWCAGSAGRGASCPGEGASSPVFLSLLSSWRGAGAYVFIACVVHSVSTSEGLGGLGRVHCI